MAPEVATAIAVATRREKRYVQGLPFPRESFSNGPAGLKGDLKGS